MVFYYTSNVVDPHATIYVGKDKFESRFPGWKTVAKDQSIEMLTELHLDEELIKYGWDEDVWYSC